MMMASPLPTAPAVLHQRGEVRTCGWEGRDAQTCVGSSTCAAMVKEGAGRIYAACNYKEPIATVCRDMSTTCTDCSTPGVLICPGSMYCATRLWYHQTSTGSDDSPYATSYFCNEHEFTQVTGTYSPSLNGQTWDMLGAFTATDNSRNQPPPTSSPAATSPIPNSGSTLSDQNSSTPPSSSSSSQGIPPGATAGIVIGAIVLLAGVTFGIFFYRRRKHAPLTLPPNNNTDRATISEKNDHELQPTGRPAELYSHPPPPSNPFAGGIEEAENDALGGLPGAEEMRRRAGGGSYGYGYAAGPGSGRTPSVMTDLDDTLTLGGGGEVDDIHAVGYQR